MHSPLFAAAGLAEFAWLIDALVIGGCASIIGIISILGILKRSPAMVVGSVAAHVLLMYLCLPWYCFYPFPGELYDDPDVLDAANHFFIAGMFWIASLVATIVGIIKLNRLKEHIESEIPN